MSSITLLRFTIQIQISKGCETLVESAQRLGEGFTIVVLNFQGSLYNPRLRGVDLEL